MINIFFTKTEFKALLRGIVSLIIFTLILLTIKEYLYFIKLEGAIEEEKNQRFMIYIHKNNRD
jgi:hypothetical protein